MGYQYAIRETRWPELGFAKVEGRGGPYWRIIDRSTGDAVGPIYRSRSELLADLTRYANEFIGLGGDVLPSLYEELKAAGIKMDSHESDLYVLETPAVRGIIAQFPMHAKNATRFRDRRDGKMWIDVPFAYDPWWKKAEARDRRRVGRQA